MKVATRRDELHKIQHKSIQVVAEGIGLRNFQCNVCLRKINTLCFHALFEFLSGRTGSSRAHYKNAGGKERRAELRRSARRQQFIITVSSWRFYNRQEEVLDEKSPKVIDRFVFNYLAADNAGQTADDKHTGSMIFPFFLLASKTGWEIILFRTSQ